MKLAKYVGSANGLLDQQLGYSSKVATLLRSRWHDRTMAMQYEGWAAQISEFLNKYESRIFKVISIFGLLASLTKLVGRLFC